MGLYYSRGGLAAALPLAEHLGLLPAGAAHNVLAGASGAGAPAPLLPTGQQQTSAAMIPASAAMDAMDAMDGAPAAKRQAWLEVSQWSPA